MRLILLESTPSCLLKQTHAILQTPILWFHGMVDEVVLFDARKAAPSFLEQAGMQCEFKVVCQFSTLLLALYILHFLLGCDIFFPL